MPAIDEKTTAFVPSTLAQLNSRSFFSVYDLGERPAIGKNCSKPGKTEPDIELVPPVLNGLEGLGFWKKPLRKALSQKPHLQASPMPSTLFDIHGQTHLQRPGVFKPVPVFPSSDWTKK
jgi:hypothetical protein